MGTRSTSNFDRGPTARSSPPQAAVAPDWAERQIEEAAWARRLRLASQSGPDSFAARISPLLKRARAEVI